MEAEKYGRVPHLTRSKAAPAYMTEMAVNYQTCALAG